MMTKKKSGIKFESRGFIFDEEKLIKRQHAAVGLIKLGDDETHYYIGQMIPKEIDVTDKKGNYRATIQKDNLMIISDNHSHFEVNTDFQKRAKVKFSDPPLLTQRRWGLKKIESYLVYEGGLAKSYKAPTPKEVFEDIRKQFKKYIYFDDDRLYDLFSLWVMGTYFFTLFEAYPYIELVGLRGTGKTKVMDIIKNLSFNGEMFVNPTPATIFRYVDLNFPTLCLDEVEDLFK